MPWHWFFYMILTALLVVGLFLNLASLPGLWVMVLATCAYAWATRAAGYIGTKMLVTLVVLALLAEAVELFAGSAGARRAGGSKRAAISAILGALIGAFALTFGVPIIGTVFGACLGAFIGALAGELTTGRGANRSVRVGIAAAKGRLIGIVAKSAFGVVILILALWSALPLRSRAAVIAPTTLTPATLPTTMP